MNIGWLIGLLIVLFCNISVAESLQEAIKTAIDLNPISQANDKRFEAAKYRASAARKDMLPSGNFSCSKNIGDYKYGGGDDKLRSYDSDCSVGLSVTLYDGFQGRNTAKAAEMRVEALAAQNNATNDLIPDTRGTLANDVFRTYRNLVELKTYIHYGEIALKRYSILLKSAKTEEQKNEVKTKIANTQNNMVEQKQAMIQTMGEYEYWVSTATPQELDNLSKISQSILIPGTAEEATAIALRKNPDINKSRFELAESEFERKAERARLYSPKVRGGVSYDKYIYKVDDSDYRYAGPSAYVQVSVPFDLASRDYSKASKLELEARELDLEKENKNVNFRINKILYPSLAATIDLNQLFSQSMYKTNEDIEDVIKKAESGQPIDIRYALSIMGDYSQQTHNYIRTQVEIVNTKFSIQQTIGTLFDEVAKALY